MSNKLRLSIEDQSILARLSIEQLQFLTKIDDDTQKERLFEAIRMLMEREKEMIFQEDGFKITPDKLYALHAYSRGVSAGYVTLFKLIRGARLELDKRSKKEKK